MRQPNSPTASSQRAPKGPSVAISEAEGRAEPNNKIKPERCEAAPKARALLTTEAEGRGPASMRSMRAHEPEPKARVLTHEPPKAVSPSPRPAVPAVAGLGPPRATVGGECIAQACVSRPGSRQPTRPGVARPSPGAHGEAARAGSNQVKARLKAEPLPHPPAQADLSGGLAYLRPSVNVRAAVGGESRRPQPKAARAGSW